MGLGLWSLRVQDLGFWGLGFRAILEHEILHSNGLGFRFRGLGFRGKSYLQPQITCLYVLRTKAQNTK